MFGSMYSIYMYLYKINEPVPSSTDLCPHDLRNANSPQSGDVKRTAETQTFALTSYSLIRIVCQQIESGAV